MFFVLSKLLKNNYFNVIIAIASTHAKYTREMKNCSKLLKSCFMSCAINKNVIKNDGIEIVMIAMVDCIKLSF